jgi:hypothetical protein
MLADAGVERPIGDEVDSPSTEDGGQLVLDVDDRQARSAPGLELHEDIDIAAGPERVREDRAEEGEFLNVVPAADCSEPVPVESDARFVRSRR